MQRSTATRSNRRGVGLVHCWRARGDGLKKIYCESGALTPEIKRLGESGCVALVHFPYDPCSQSRRFADVAIPSRAQICDLNLPISDLPGTIADYSGSVHFAEILSILGGQRRDASR